MKSLPAPPRRTSRWRVLLLLGSQSPQRMSLPAPPDRRSEPWWPRISSLDEPPAFVRLELSRTFHRTPVTAGQPLWVALAPPPLVWRALPPPPRTPPGGAR